VEHVIENAVFHESHVWRALPTNPRAVPCVMNDAGRYLNCDDRLAQFTKIRIALL